MHAYICMTESLFCTPELTQYSKSTILCFFKRKIKRKNGSSYSIHFMSVLFIFKMTYNTAYS